MRKCLITGAGGYLAGQLTSFLAAQGIETALAGRQGSADIAALDLGDADAVARHLEAVAPDVVVHTTAISNVSGCERDPDEARRVNTDWTANLARATAKAAPKAKLVFLSSDYVFDGTRGGYAETDQPNPSTVYGKTKLDAEKAVADSGANHLIVRTANVFGRGGNFFNFLMGKLSARESVEVFYDTLFTPTYVDYFLDTLLRLVEKDQSGLIHLVGPERLSRYDVARKLARALGRDERLAVPVAKPESLGLAPDSSLDSSLLRQTLGNYCPDFDKALNYALGRLVYPYFSHFDIRGGIFGISQGRHWEEINYVESARGAVRGNHFHKHTLEGFFIIDGKIRIEVKKLDEDTWRSFIVERGDSLLIKPGTLHTFHVLEGAKWINFLSKAMKGEVKDFHRP